MIHQEMIDQVSDELRNTKIQTKITRWLNMSIIELATQYIFGHLHKYLSKNTIAGNPDIVMDSDFLWLKMLQIPADSTKIYFRDENVIEEAYPSYRITQGTITHYYLNGITLGLWQVPSGIKTLTGAYQKRPAKLIDDLSITCDLPEEWHQLVTQKATTKGYDYEGNTEGSVKSKSTESQILARLGSSIYKRPDETVIMGGSSYRTRPPRPQLPANYPSGRY